ncbi:MAG: AAA family ATPase [Bacillota bacterium]|nr:ATPase [Bacillota bacterium]
MKRDVLFGAALGAGLFLVTIGSRVWPALLVLVLAGAFVFLARAQGMPFPRRDASFARACEATHFAFDQIGGQEHAKRELMEALEFLRDPEKAQRYGIRPLKGILLYGPPGTGKTLLAKAAAAYTDSVFVAASGSDFIQMYVGVGAQRVRELFRQVRAQANARRKTSGIIFIDEIDAIGGKREGGLNREYDQTLNQLLTEMDGLNANENPRILVIAATNRLDMLDPALLRPGRFDRHIAVPLPDRRAREAILRLHTRNKPLADDVDLVQLAKDTFGFSGAQLESVANEAAIYALREDSPVITRAHFAKAVDKVMMGEVLDREASREEKERVAVHEMGHALVSEALRPGSVAQVALAPRGQALGYVRQTPPDDRYLYTRSQLEARIMVALAGAVAEELEFGEYSTGARGDFDQVQEMVRQIIDHGLSDLGLVDRETADKAALQREHEAIVRHLWARTRALLEERRDALRKGAQILLDEEWLDGARLRTILTSHSPRNMVS